jgi:predicted GIY-YIG superfamily endonuclease
MNGGDTLLLPMMSGVYFLWRDESALQYVGSSLHIQNRIAQHIWGRRIRFTHYSVVEVNDDRLLSVMERIENAYIKALEPPHNSRTKGATWEHEAAMVKEIQRAWGDCEI